MVTKPFSYQYYLNAPLQYIFVNMFTGESLSRLVTFDLFLIISIIGVVVENFSYVFQASGGAKSITREEMRSFKKVWAEFANEKGFLEKHKFVPFFGVRLFLVLPPLLR